MSGDAGLNDLRMLQQSRTIPVVLLASLLAATPARKVRRQKIPQLGRDTATGCVLQEVPSYLSLWGPSAVRNCRGCSLLQPKTF
jgi:hypothetical protein